MVLHRSTAAVSTSGRCIQAGDLVIVYERFDSMKSVYVTPGESYGNRYGNFKLKDWIGKPFGSRVESTGRGSTGWVYLLEPTPELWTTVLRHRTQILYVADISMVCTFLELKPGCVVLESGTGSGSLTHSLARAIAPTGHVHTFEFHQPRAEAADKEFKEHGMGDIITVQQRNIEELGFPEELHNKADGLFLDLPGPWHAVESAAKCLRPNAVFCSFSPCIEQVQRTCAALEDNGFFAVRTMECLLRRYEVKQEKMTVVDDTFSAQQQTGNAKRKRQEDFQSRKRQALDQVANAVPSAETVTALENGPPAVNAVINTASTAAFESDSSNPAGTKAAPVPALVVGSPNLASTTTQPSPVTKGNNALAMDAVTKAAPAPAFEIASLSPAVTSTQSELITKGNNAASVDAVTQAATQPAVDGNGSISLASTDVQPDPKHIRFAQMLLAAVHQSSPGVIPSQLQQPSAESSHVVKLAGSISQLLENGIPSTIIEAANAAKEYVLGSSQSTLPENPANRELKQKPALPQVQKCVVAKPVNDARGHTGYLTFARRSVDD